MNFQRDIGYSGRGCDDINRKPPTAEQSIPCVRVRVWSSRVHVHAHLRALALCADRLTMRPADPWRYDRAKCNRDEKVHHLRSAPAVDARDCRSMGDLVTRVAKKYGRFSLYRIGYNCRTIAQML